jgi:hypothetical protein
VRDYLKAAGCCSYDPAKLEEDPTSPCSLTLTVDP